MQNFWLNSCRSRISSNIFWYFHFNEFFWAMLWILEIYKDVPNIISVTLCICLIFLYNNFFRSKLQLYLKQIILFSSKTKLLNTKKPSKRFMSIMYLIILTITFLLSSYFHCFLHFNSHLNGFLPYSQKAHS